MNAVDDAYVRVADHVSAALVTGSAGFIGSHLVEWLLRSGLYVLGVDSYTDYYPRWMKEQNIARVLGHEHFALIEGDLVDLDLAALLRGRSSAYQQLEPSRGKDHQLDVPSHIDYVFHFAAQPGVRASWGSNFQVYVRNNVLATQRLLEAARDASLKKFVYASSSSVYGDARTLPTPEDATPRPVSPYGVTKLAAEHLCQLYRRSYGLPTVCLRFFTVYGPRQRPDMAFHRFIKAMLRDEEITVYGDGQQTRDFAYVDETVHAATLAGVTEHAEGALNIGGGSRVTINEVIEMLECILGKRARVRYVESQSGDMHDTAADITRARKVLGFQPRTSLAAGLQAEVQWLAMQVKHPTGATH